MRSRVPSPIVVALLAALLPAIAGVARLGAIRLDIGLADIERALAIGRDRDSERARFHAPYIRAVNNAFISEVEVVSEFRRVVLNAERQIRMGDHASSYSASSGQQGLAPWRGQVAIIVRVRFHPQNNYVGVPDVTVAMLGGSSGELKPNGVLRDPVLATLTGVPGEHIPVLGAIVEASFDALPLMDQRPRTVVVHVDGKEVGRVEIDFSRLE
jgi:hypothetical protein